MTLATLAMLATLATLCEILEKGNATQPFTPQLYPIVDVVADLLYEADVTRFASAILERLLVMFSGLDASTVAPFFARVIRELGGAPAEFENVVRGVLAAVYPAIAKFPQKHVRAPRDGLFRCGPDVCFRAILLNEDRYPRAVAAPLSAAARRATCASIGRGSGRPSAPSR